jgi:hypothetical protein
MHNFGPPSNPEFTPSSYRCPGCRNTVRMQIAWPWWICPNCRSRLIPADSPSSIGKAKEEPINGKELRIDPGAPEKAVPEPNAPTIAIRPSAMPPAQPQRP